MKFDINNYKGKYAMHCKTEEEASEFCNYLHSIGRKWSDGTLYSECTEYDDYWCNTTYDFNDDSYGNIKWFYNHNYIVLEFSDFDWTKEFTKADLKTGDVVLRRNGDVEIVNCELEMLICQSGGWNDLNDIRNDLTHFFYKTADIIEVRRPRNNCDCCFDAMSICRRGTLVYKRKEVEEMTLEQVCKLLGKEIKIIK